MQQNGCQSGNRTGTSLHCGRKLWTHTAYTYISGYICFFHWPVLHMSTRYKFDMKIWILINYKKNIWHSLRWFVKMANQHTLHTKDARKWDKNIFECPASVFVYYSGSGCRYNNIISILHTLIISPSRPPPSPPPPPTYLKVKRKGWEKKSINLFLTIISRRKWSWVIRVHQNTQYLTKLNAVLRSI